MTKLTAAELANALERIQMMGIAHHFMMPFALAGMLPKPEAIDASAESLRVDGVTEESVSLFRMHVSGLIFDAVRLRAAAGTA